LRAVSLARNALDISNSAIMRWLSKTRAVNPRRAPLRAPVPALPRPVPSCDGASAPRSWNVAPRSPYSTSVKTQDSKITNDELNLLARVVFSDPRSRQEHGDLDAPTDGTKHAPIVPPALQGFKTIPVLRFLETLIAVDATTEEKELVAVTIQNMSSSTFSEMLRSLDPLTVVGPEMDPLFGKFAGPGLARHTQLEKVVDIYGVRGVYMLLSKCIVGAVKARMGAGHGLLVSDYKQLIRCAGATSDPVAARKAYRLMDDHDVRGIRDGDLFTEFIKARFLTEPLYTQFDMMRRRVAPINLYMQKSSLRLGSRGVCRLRRLRRHTIGNQVHRYGHNRHADYAEHLTRMLRKTKPVGRLWRWHMRKGYEATEDLVCSAMIAFARTGSMDKVRHMLYKEYWIQVNDKARNAGTIEIRESKAMRRSNPLRPTGRLCEAVVECFGCNGEVVTALRLLIHISDRYRLTIPDKAWFDLLSWAQVRLSKPASTEWNVLRWPNKEVPKDAILQIWKIMTSEPFNVRPGWEQYDILIKSLISYGRKWHPHIIELMATIYPQYGAVLQEVEEAAYEVALSDRSGMDKTAALRQWEHALAKKEYMWYTIVVWCWTLLKKSRPRQPLDSFAVRLVPKLLDQFRDFFPRNITYRIATGIVTLYNPDQLHRVVRDRYLSLQPAIVTGDMVRKPWDTLKPLRYRDVPLASFHRRKMVVKTHRSSLRNDVNFTNHLRDLLAEGSLPVDQIQRHFT
jgi:hypothetical protein